MYIYTLSDLLCVICFDSAVPTGGLRLVVAVYIKVFFYFFNFGQYYPLAVYCFLLLCSFATHTSSVLLTHYYIAVTVPQFLKEIAN